MNFKLQKRRSGQLSEFGAAFIVLLMVIMPLINVSFVPVRYLLCQAILADRVSSLAHCEKRSDVYVLLERDQSWKSLLSKVGVTVSNEQVAFVATTSDGKQKQVLLRGQLIPPQWLPDGSNEPLIYSVSLKADCSIPPAVYGASGPPGLTAPVRMTINTDAQWENTSADPESLKYFIDE